MTEQQFEILTDLLGLAVPDRDAAHAAIYGGQETTVVATEIADRLRLADAAIRSVYVIHGPGEFRITVGQRDIHRVPGALTINMGDTVRLVALSTERWVPVRVTALPAKPTDYYSGVIVKQLVKASRYVVGNGVRFSEDQVTVEEPRAGSRNCARDTDGRSIIANGLTRSD